MLVMADSDRGFTIFNLKASSLSSASSPIWNQAGGWPHTQIKGPPSHLDIEALSVMVYLQSNWNQAGGWLR